MCSVERTIYSKARFLLLGEPLAAMGAGEARLIIGLIERLRARGEITFESQAAATAAEELLEIVRREYLAVCAG